MAHESYTFGTYQAMQAQAILAGQGRDYSDAAEAAYDDDLPPISPGWWIIPSVLCGGSMIASAVLLF